jgi:hypothetical protein
VQQQARDSGRIEGGGCKLLDWFLLFCMLVNPPWSDRQGALVEASLQFFRLGEVKKI